MFARFYSICFILFFVNTLTSAADTRFEIIDNAANNVCGTIITLDKSQIFADIRGTTHTIPLVELVKIRNIAPNPYEKNSSSTSDYQNPVQQMQSVRGVNEQRFAETSNKPHSNEHTLQKNFPGNVVALELKDGTRLTASSFTVAKNQGVVRLLDQQNDLTFPLDKISAVRFAVRGLPEVISPPADWLRLTIPNVKGDRLVVGNPGSFDVYTGILNDISAETISFAIDGEILPIPRRKVFGIVLHGESSSSSADGLSLLGILKLWTGTKGMISDIRLAGNELTWQTTSGLIVVVPLEMVNEIDFCGKEISYLVDCELVRSEFSLPFESDIKPSQLKFLQTFYENRTKNSSCEAILDGVVYGKSITLMGRTSLEYPLPKPFASLKAVIGIEDQFRPYAAATLQILADLQILGTWELRGDSASKQILLNLPKNCRLLTIITEPLPQSNVPAVLTIAEPKLFE